MPSHLGTRATALLNRLRAVRARHPATARLLFTAVAALGLWLFAFQRFSEPQKGAPRFRIDANEIVAYPKSDAAMDFLNATAILSGDGWVNWRNTNRWSVYRAGWGAFLAGLAAITGRDIAAMQQILNVLFAASAPIFLLLVMQLFPGGRDLLLGTVAAVVFVLSPLGGWWFQRTMMSEGPTLLLSLLFCLLAIRWCGRLGRWSWRQGLLLGLVAAALCLVRSQSRFGVLAVFALLAAASAGRLRRRLPFLVLMGCGLLALLGPLYLKTSIHLRMPYFGTPHDGLYAVLGFTEIGRRAGGPLLPEGAELSERDAMRLLQGRVRDGIEMARESTPQMLANGFLHYTRYIQGSIAKVVQLRAVTHRGEPRPPTLVVFYLLTAVGIYFAWRRVGPVALAPLAFSLAYVAPMVPFWYFITRLGIPIAWVGLAYIAGSLLAFGGAPPRVEPEGAPAPSTEGRDGGGAWPGRRFWVALGAWLTFSTAALLWLDLAPLPRVDVARLFAEERAQETLRQAGIEAAPELVAEADRLLNGDGRSDRLLAGIAVFPMTINPRDSPVPQPFSRGELPPGTETYSIVYVVSPWKRGGSFRISRVALRGAVVAGLRNGDPVVVVRAPDSAESVGERLVVQLQGAAVLPTRWAD